MTRRTKTPAAPRGFYVVGVYGDAAALLSPSLPREAAEGLTLAEARRAVWWQYQPRGESSTPWYICQRDPNAPGIMLGHRAELAHPSGGPGSVQTRDGEPERLDIGASRAPYTKAAHDSFLAAIWPDAGE